MAILAFVTEYASFPQQMGVVVQAAQEPGLKNASSPLTVTTHVESAAFDPTTVAIKVHVTGGNVSYSVGANPTATTSDMRMPTDHTEVLGVVPTHKISFVTASQ